MDFKGIGDLVTTVLTLNNSVIEESLKAIMGAEDLTDEQKKEFRAAIIESKK